MTAPRLCSICGAPAVPSVSYCPEHNAARQREYRRRIKEGITWRVDEYRVIACPTCPPELDVTGMVLAKCDLRDMLHNGYFPSGAIIQSPTGARLVVRGPELAPQQVECQG